MTVNQRLKFITKSKGLTQKQLSDISGVSQEVISRTIRGRSLPSFDQLTRIYLAFSDLNAHWLLTGEGEPFSGSENTESMLYGLDEKQIEFIFKAQEKEIELLKAQLDIHEKWSDSLERELTLLREKVRMMEKMGYNIAAEPEAKYKKTDK